MFRTPRNYRWAGLALALLFASCSVSGGSPDGMGQYRSSATDRGGGSPIGGSNAPRLNAASGPRSDDLYDIYQGVLTRYVERVNHIDLIQGALRGFHTAVVAAGVPPMDADLVQTVSVRETDDPNRDWGRFASAYDAFLAKAGGRVDDGSIGYAVAGAMLEALNDPQTIFFDPQQVQDQARGVVGVGITLAQPGGEVTIVREVTRGGPSEQAGIRSGDALIAVDDAPTHGMNVSQIVQHIRGKVDSTVKLTMRPGAGETLTELLLTRKPLIIPALDTELNDGVLRVRVRAFQDGVSDAARADLARSVQDGATGWIVDLRGNASGNLQEAVNFASLFVGDKTVGFSVDRGQRRSVLRGAALALRTLLPTVVLVDENTGAGAELLAAALKEHGQAVVLGTRTAGRAGIASTATLSDGSAMQVTTQRILSPSGESLDGVGLEPDERVEASAADWAAGRDPQVERALRRLSNGD